MLAMTRTNIKLMMKQPKLCASPLACNSSGCACDATVVVLNFHYVQKNEYADSSIFKTKCSHWYDRPSLFVLFIGVCYIHTPLFTSLTLLVNFCHLIFFNSSELMAEN